MGLFPAVRRSGLSFVFAASLLVLTAATSASAQTRSFVADTPEAGSSSSTALSESSSLDPLPDAPVPAYRDRHTRALPSADREPRPFHSLAVGLTLGTGGIGIELATPLNTKFNLRGGASFFGYHTSFVVDTVPIDGTLHLSNINAVIDYFPRARSFHISPGITFYDNTRYDATIFVPGNQIVNFNGQDYLSDPNDPIRGTANIQFGRTVAPRLTIGYGNVIRHNTPHFTFPVEIGFEVIHTPTAIFNLTGSSCTIQGDCSPINDDPETRQNILEQQNDINSDIKPLRIFPIISFGVSYKFGH